MKKVDFQAWRAKMTERYLIARDSVLAGCLVTPEVYEGILERFENFVAPFIEHLHKRVQRQKAIDDMKRKSLR